METNTFDKQQFLHLLLRQENYQVPIDQQTYPKLLIPADFILLQHTSCHAQHQAAASFPGDGTGPQIPGQLAHYHGGVIDRIENGAPIVR